MTEPTVAATFAGIGAVATGFTLAGLLGIEYQPLLYACAGGFFGSSFAPPVHPVILVLRFPLASLISALAASAGAKWWSVTEPLYINLLACAVSFGFYPITKAIISRVPDIVRATVGRAFGLDAKGGDKNGTGGQP